MQINEFLNSVCEQIKYKPIRKNIAKELENHIEESKENYMKDGLKEKEAEEKAIIQMGNAEEIGKGLNKIHKPKLDWKLIIIVLIMMCFGFLIAFTKTANLTTENIQINYMQKYLIFFIIALVLGAIIYFVDYKKMLKLSDIIYVFASGIIFFAITFGAPVNGIPYIRVGTIFISASVVAVPLYIISFVGFMNEEIKENKVTKILMDKKINVKTLKILILGMISLLLLILIPSKASAFILGLVYLILITAKIIVENKDRKNKLIKLWGTVIAISLLLAIYVVCFEPYIFNRFKVVFNPKLDVEARWMVRIK